MLKIPAKRLPLTDYEKELVRFCAKHYAEKGEFLPYVNFPRYNELGREKIVATHIRLDRFGLLLGSSSDSARISPTVLELVEEWDHPPLPDYRDWLTKWFWSKRWSLVIYALVVGFPAVVGWVVLGKTISEWWSTR